MITQARRALEYLHPDNFFSRIRAIWTLGFAYQVQGDRAAASQAYAEAMAISQASGNIRMHHRGYDQPGRRYRNLKIIFTWRPRPSEVACSWPVIIRQPFENEAHLGLARIFYEWNDLEAAEQHGQQGLQLARQYDRVIDRYILSEVFLARLKLARGDVAGAAVMLAETAQTVRENNFVHRISEVAAAQVLVLLRQGDVAAAAHLAETHELPLSRARVLLAQGDPSAALAVLKPLRRQMEARGWQDERLKVMVLQAVAHHAHGEKDEAVQLLSDALALAEPEGFIRLFVDEGEPMRMALSDVRLSIQKQLRGQGHGLLGYVDKLLAAFAQSTVMPQLKMAEPLSQRELEVLRLVAQGLSNQEIGERLFLALDTVKGHNRSIFGKLQVQRRTEAIARARELGLL